MSFYARSFGTNMAEALGTAASIIAALGLTKSAVSLLCDIKNAPEDCTKLLQEISFTRGILDSLKDTVAVVEQ